MNLCRWVFRSQTQRPANETILNAKGTHIAIKYRKTSSEDEFEAIFSLFLRVVQRATCNEDSIRGSLSGRGVEGGTSYFLFLSSNPFMFSSEGQTQTSQKEDDEPATPMVAWATHG
jgi:hypothetical protein